MISEFTKNDTFKILQVINDAANMKKDSQKKLCL